MGQPIFLRKGDETITVYGRAQAAVHVGEGWRLVDQTINLPTSGAAVVESSAVDATAAAVKLASQYNIDLSEMVGTGAGGRLTKGDVQRLIDNLSAIGVIDGD